MLRLGVFGGKYMTDTRNEFPKSWFARAKLSPRGRDSALNFFGVDASQPLSVWRDKGWLHPDDPRGWFQWYCRYYHGPPPARGGSPPDQALEGDAPAHPPDRAQLRARPPDLPPRGNGRRCCIGRMTAGKFERAHDRLFSGADIGVVLTSIATRVLCTAK